MANWPTNTLPVAKSRDAGIRICIAAAREPIHTAIVVNITTYCEAYMVSKDQWYTATLMQPADCTIIQWSPASHMRTVGNDKTKSECSHHCPNWRQGAIAITLRLSALGCLIEQSFNRHNKTPGDKTIAIMVRLSAFGHHIWQLVHRLTSHNSRWTVDDAEGWTDLKEHSLNQIPCRSPDINYLST